MRTLCTILVLAACHHAPPATTPAPPPDPTTTTTSTTTTTTTTTAAVDPAPKVEGDITDAWVRGIHVIVKRIPGAEATATQLYARGGARNWDATTAGAEQLAIDASVSGGTESLDRDAFSQRLSNLGSTLAGYASNDFSVMYTWSLTPRWDDTFGLLVDAFRHPALPSAIVEVSRARQLAGIQQEDENPDARLGKLVHETMFRGHPYEHRSIGTLATVKGFTIPQLKAQLAKLRETSRLLLVVVGDVDASHVIEATAKALGDLPRGAYVEAPFPPLVQDKASTTLIEQKLPTNYIEAVMPGPTWKTPDQIVIGSVAMNLLHQREFEEVRTKRNLSYAPSAFIRGFTGAPMLGLYVTAVDPITTMKVMLAEAKKLRDQPVPDKELASTKASFLTGVFQDAEAPNDQATQLASSQLYGGDWRLVRDLPKAVQAVTAAQIQTWAKTYLQHLHTFVIGDPQKVDKASLEAF